MKKQTMAPSNQLLKPMKNSQIDRDVLRDALENNYKNVFDVGFHT